MKKFKIKDMDLAKDKPQINMWQTEHAGSSEFESIQKFILEGGSIGGLSELIENNFENCPIGADEIKKSVAVESEDGQIIGFMIFQVHDIAINKPSMFLQYIVINPEFQHKGYGKEILTEIFSDPKKHIGIKPQEVFCYVDNENYSSQKLFMDFGFSMSMQRGSSLFKATGNMPTIQKLIEEASINKN